VIPQAVRGWCLIAIAANAIVVGLATSIFRNAAPLLVGAIFTLFPLYMLLFWNDIASTVDGAKQRASAQYPSARINLSVQWAAISICATAPVMIFVLCLLLWFTRMKH
jgi:hypothetical protein